MRTSNERDPPPVNPQGQQPPPGNNPQGYYQQEPPKKKHTVRNVLLILTLLFILFVGGCIALIGGAANEIDQAIQEEEKNDVPTDIVEGEAFTHDGYDADAGWKVTKDAIGGVTINGLRITNSSDEGQRTALFDIAFYKGTENLAEVSCSSNEVQAGESSKMDCVSTSGDFPKGYDTIKVADVF